MDDKFSVSKDETQSDQVDQVEESVPEPEDEETVPETDDEESDKDDSA